MNPKRGYFSNKLSNLIKTKKSFEYKDQYFHDYYNIIICKSNCFNKIM